MKIDNIIKSPLNYTGGKYKLLTQILPLIPEDIDTFVDLFCGGCDVGANVNASRVICNDIDEHLIDLLENLRVTSSYEARNKVKSIIETYRLSKTNQNGYLRLRSDYNDGFKQWYVFYALITHAFNNEIRFNKKGEYNVSFGHNKSWFNPTLEQRFVKFTNRLGVRDIAFTSVDFTDYDLDSLTPNDFVYCDPPYLITDTNYNRHYGWDEDSDKKLYDFLDDLNDRNIRFALSNVFENRGKTNAILIDWAEKNQDKYKVHFLNYSYGNSNYQIKNKNKAATVEVLITNY